MSRIDKLIAEGAPCYEVHLGTSLNASCKVVDCRYCMLRRKNKKRWDDFSEQIGQDTRER